MSDKNILISLVVPVYNVERYLNQCVDSILNQTYKNFELFLIDDGSKDNSPKICDEYAKKDSRVKVIHQANGGQVKARKAGLALASGEYIQFIDSDDWIELNALEKVVECIKKESADIVTFDSYFCYSNRKLPVKQPIESGVFDKKELIKKIYPKMIYSGRFFYFGIYAAMWNKVFRRSLLQPNMENVNPKLRIGEDGVTTFASFLDANKVCVLGGEHLYDYRDNNVSITRSYCNEQFDNAKLLIQTLRDINKVKNVFDLNNQIDYYLMYNVYSIFIEEFYYKYKKSFSSRIKYLKQIFNDSEVRSVVGLINIESLDKSFRSFFSKMRSGNFVVLILITIFIAYKKRLKIFVKK